MGIKLYNKVPDSIQKLVNFKLFKKELKSLLLSHFCYSVNEFLQFWVKLVFNVWDYSLVILNNFIRVILIHFTIVFIWNIIEIIVLLHHMDNYSMIVAVWDFVYIFKFVIYS